MASVSGLLDAIGLGPYAETFKENAIGWDVLLHLNDDVLKDIGVRAAGDRIRILHAIESLRARDESPEPPVCPAPWSQYSSSGMAERRQLTVLFCDLVGSTELA